jgi:hypothetical protein
MSDRKQQNEGSEVLRFSPITASRVGVYALFAAFLLSSAEPSLNAQMQPPASASAQASLAAPAKSPSRIARLTFVVGDVRVDRQNDTNAQAAVLNMPLSEGSVLSAGDDGQAEIEFEDGSVARLTPNSALSLVNLSLDGSGNAQSRLALLSGLAYFELRAGTLSKVSVDAQGDLITPVENSTIRVNLDEPPAIISVLDGMAHVDYQAGDQPTALADVAAGQTLRSDSIPSQTGAGRFLVKQEIDPESWDEWNEARDQAAGAEASNQTAARGGFAGNQGYGWSDLDANGSWYNVPGQGEVWQPDVAADPGDNSADGFDPYDFGNWVWQPSAGYVWASGYSWGWTPYRCGTWNYWDSFGWGWSPGLYCGAYGFGGYGYGINFGRIPRIFHRPLRPIPRPGPHPIVRVHGGIAPLSPGGHIPVTTSKVIAGRLADPLPAIGGGSTPRGGTALGGALVRDYPVDRTSHQPVLGVASNHEAFGSAYAGRSAPWHPVGNPSSQMRPVLPIARPTYAPPAGAGSAGDAGSRGTAGSAGDRGGYYPQVHGAPVIRQEATPHYAPPAPRSAPAPQSAPRSAPAPASSPGKAH